MTTEPVNQIALTDAQRMMLPGLDKFLKVANALPTSTAAAPIVLAAPATPDVAQAVAFFSALYPQQRGEIVHFRGVPEPKDARHPKNLHYTLDENFNDTLRGFLDWCNVDQRAAFFLPGTVRGAGTGKADVLSVPAILIDFDKGNPDANLAAAEALLGPATVIVESGGVVEGRPKLHAYWRLAEPATMAAIGAACAAREALALRFGGDPAFKQAAQVIRIPGSVHFKGTPKRVELRTVRPELSYQLDEIVRAAGPVTGKSSDNSNVVNFFDFNNVNMPHSDVERVLTQPIHEGAVDDMTRYDGAGKAIGHFIRMVREGRYDLDGAWEAVKGWNAATLVPPWDEDRLRNDFQRLLDADVAAKGPLALLAPAIPQAATGLRLTDWYARDKFVGDAPERRWLVEGLIPRGTPGVFAAVGDAGKSMLALRLANIVASHPAPRSTADGPAGVNDTASFFGQPVVGRGTAVFLTGEDDEAEVHRRLCTVDPSGVWRGEQSRLIVLPLLSAGGAHAFIASGPRGPEFTPAWHELRTQLEAIPDLALVVLDPLTLFVGGDTNDNAVGAAMMGELNRLATKTGAAIMVVHHFAKGAKITGLADARGAVLGAGAWVNNGRWGLVLWEASSDDAYSVLKPLGRAHQSKQAGVVYFGGLTKGNAPGAKTQRTLVRGAAGVLEDCTEELRSLFTPRTDVDAILHRELLALRQVRGHCAFTASPTALWTAWGQIIRKCDLPITKDGKARGKDAVADVFARMLDAGLLAETADRGTAPRYEPIELP